MSPDKSSQRRFSITTARPKYLWSRCKVTSQKGVSKIKFDFWRVCIKVRLVVGAVFLYFELDFAVRIASV